MLITTNHIIQDALTQDVLQKPLFEDFIDDLSDEEISSETVNVQHTYEHEMIWHSVLVQMHLLCVHT